ncbi:MAG: PaaI family thioesterase [Deltaproteobacteria bacterium]|nr:PaaI family thioesterase [Deltaproteobacteria bacterium]
MISLKKPMQDIISGETPGRDCFGCGADNPYGLHLKSCMEGDIAVSLFTPEPYHIAFPGIVNGGIIATIIDCHGIWASIGYYILHYKSEVINRPNVMYVTRKLTIEYLEPTPMGELTLRGWVTKECGRSSTAQVELFSNDQLCACGEVVGVRLSTFDLMSKFKIG